MLKTFNCGVGFCIIAPKNVNKIKRLFSSQFKPYVIGHLSKDKKALRKKLFKMVKKKYLCFYFWKRNKFKNPYLNQEIIIFLSI